MSLLNRFAGAALLSFISFANSVHAAPNIIDATYGVGAGSFEIGSFSPRGSGPSNFQSLLSGSAAVTGWTVGGVGVDWLSAPDYAASDGVHAIDLGYFEGGAGTISTSIATIVGATYNLSFSAAAVPGFPTYNNAGHVSAGSLVGQAFAPAFSLPHDFTHQIYTDYSFNFVALSGTTSIMFGADAPDTAYGPVIDNVSASLVSLPSGVPEPTTWALMLFGFGSVGFAMRRQNRTVVSFA